jgi:uncharacterized membrane protein
MDDHQILYAYNVPKCKTSQFHKKDTSSKLWNSWLIYLILRGHVNQLVLSNLLCTTITILLSTVTLSLILIILQLGNLFFQMLEHSKSGLHRPFVSAALNNFIDFISNVLLSVYMRIFVFVCSYKTYYKNDCK